MSDMDMFIEAIRDDKFVEAHEILEKSWKRLKKSDLTEANIQKGLINGATAIALYLRGKKEPAQRVWKTFEKYRVLIGENEFFDTVKYKIAEEILDEKYKRYDKLQG